MNCNCEDENNEIATIPKQDCPFNLKQIQRLAFIWRGQVIWDSATGGGLGDGVPQANSQLDTKADWDARISATDKTKMVLTPRIGGDPVINAGEIIYEGGDGNDTFNGAKEFGGKKNSTFSCKFKSLKPEVEEALNTYHCNDIEVLFIGQGNKVYGKRKTGEKKVKGFNLLGFGFTDRNNNGHGTRDFNELSFELEPYWSQDLVQVTPKEFDAIYDWS